MRRVAVVSAIPKLYESLQLNHAKYFGDSVVHLSCHHTADGDEVLESIQQANVVIGEPALLAHAFQRQPPPECLEWVQSTFAGVNQLTQMSKNSPSPSFKLTRVGGFFGPHMAEFCIGQIVSRERKFQELYNAQKEFEWASEGYNYRRLSNLTFGIMGVGDIGTCIVTSLETFGCTKIRGLVSRPRPESVCISGGIGMSHVKYYVGTDSSQLREFLTGCDYVINTLPSTTHTRGLLDNNVLACCETHPPVFINVGRGDIISEEQIISALENIWLSGAILDVFPTEPLYKESPLWAMKGVTITPHVAAKSQADQVLELFKDNWDKYIKGESLLYEVDWEKEY